jgi:hypothetical protein
MFWVKLALPSPWPRRSQGPRVFEARFARAAEALLVPSAHRVLRASPWLSAPGERMGLVLGHVGVAPVRIALIGPAFAATFWAMKGLAPTRPVAAGAFSGLLAGAVGAAVYCLHCPEMASPFLGTWYLLGMAIPSAAGAVAGPRLLRW